MPASGASAEIPLHTLLNRVIGARAELARQRHANLGPAAMDGARAQMVLSLEAYTGALTTRHLPVPYALRDELRTQQGASRGNSPQPGARDLRLPDGHVSRR